MVESETTSSANVMLVPTSVGLVVRVTASLKVMSPVAATVVAPRMTVPSALVVRLASRWPAWPRVPSPPTTPPKVVTPEPDVFTLSARAVPLESIVEPKVTSCAFTVVVPPRTSVPPKVTSPPAAENVASAEVVALSA